MKHLYFVRHGLSVMNQQGTYSGHTDTPLADEGIEQARAAGQAAKDIKVDVIVSSPLQRAHHTAKLIAEEIGYPLEEIILEDHLIERHHGVLENTPYVPGTPMDGVEGAEQSHEIVARASRALERLRALDYETILVVSHGGFGRALRSHLSTAHPYSDVSQDKDKLPNATIIKFL
jgi:probable phosphoglycerate mutase